MPLGDALGGVTLPWIKIDITEHGHHWQGGSVVYPLDGKLPEIWPEDCDAELTLNVLGHGSVVTSDLWIRHGCNCMKRCVGGVGWGGGYAVARSGLIRVCTCQVSRFFSIRSQLLMYQSMKDMQVTKMIAVQRKNPPTKKWLRTGPATLNDETDVRMAFHVV